MPNNELIAIIFTVIIALGTTVAAVHTEPIKMEKGK